MKTILLATAFVVLAAAWSIERLSATRLAIEVDTRRGQVRELTELRRERDRLRTLQPSIDELASLRLAAAGRAPLQIQPAAPETASTLSHPPLPLGDWSPAREWQNRGRATPHATIETTLWAAAGGDTGTLKNLLSLTEETRTQADALLARLPASARTLYASPEDLIAAFTIKNIPIGEAQLVWLNENGADDATACVFLKKPPTAVGSPAPAPSQPAGVDPRDRPPPALPADGRTMFAVLSLHREDDAWHLVVPPSAVNRIAKELAAAPTR